MTTNIKLGIHAANNAGIPALMAKVELIVCKRMYENDNARPIPSESPMPPFLFLAEREAPMMVRIKEANDVAMRL